MSMPVYCLEMRNTQEWSDVRYREYTTSVKKAERFKSVPKIKFTDSGHGIVHVVTERAGNGKRLPTDRTLVGYVEQAMKGSAP
jgi:phage-related protein